LRGGAATAAGARAVHALHATVQRRGPPQALLDAGQMHARTGGRYYRCGLYTEGGHLLQLAALIRGMADALPDTVRLHENSPVLALRRAGKRQSQTPSATITADCIIMATNAAVTRFGYLRDRLVTTYT